MSTLMGNLFLLLLLLLLLLFFFGGTEDWTYGLTFARIYYLSHISSP
jgi:hypothetical protein